MTEEEKSDSVTKGEKDANKIAFAEVSIKQALQMVQTKYIKKFKNAEPKRKIS